MILLKNNLHVDIQLPCYGTDCVTTVGLIAVIGIAHNA